MENQAKNYERLFYQHLSEDVTVGDALGGSPAGDAIGPYDVEYAKHDHRIPMGGVRSPGDKKRKRKKSKKHKRDGSLDVLIPMQSRPFPGGM